MTTHKRGSYSTTALPQRGSIQREILEVLAINSRTKEQLYAATAQREGHARGPVRDALQRTIDLGMVDIMGNNLSLSELARSWMEREKKASRPATPKYTGGSIATGRAHIPFRPLTQTISTRGMRPGSNDHLSWASKL